MRTWIALLVVLAVIAAVLVFGLGLFDEEADTGSSDPATGNGNAVPGSGGEEPGGEEPGDEEPGAELTAPSPEKMPALELFPVREDVNVLLLVGIPQRFNLFLAQQWDHHDRIKVHAWAAPLPDGVGDTVPSGDVLPGLLPSAPRAVTLDDQDIDVVAVHDLDPDTLERDFWLEVVKRVKEGRLGLLVVPGTMRGRAMLDHDVLSTILPVSKATEIAGQPVPGTFRTLASYVPTEDGLRHPATRLVSWPSWSRRIWGSFALIENPWGTKVCYPVEEVPADAAVLLEAKPADAEALPAVIAGAPENGRVLWFGGWDLGGRHAYGRPKIVGDWKVLVVNWATWLAGQVED